MARLINGIGYVVGSYPSVSQAFVLREMIQLEAMGVGLVVFAIRKPPTSSVLHPETQKLQGRVIYLAIGSNVARAARTLLAHLSCFLRSPLAYSRALWFVVRRKLTLVASFVHAGVVAEATVRNGIAHLHAHFAGDSTSVALIASLMSGVPYTFTVHARDIFIPDQFLTDKIEFAQGVIAISAYNRRHLAGILNDEFRWLLGKVHVIPLGVRCEDYIGLRMRDRDNELHEIPVLLTVARLVEKKGHRHVIEALAILVERDLPVRWIIVGDGPEEAGLLERIRAEGLLNLVEFVGAANSAEVQRLLSVSDLFVLPCIATSEGDMDGIPVSLMEAMAAGVPVISTPISGIPELIENQISGLLVEPGDGSALADAIQLMVEDADLRKRISTAAGNRITERFQLATNVSELKELFEVV